TTYGPGLGRVRVDDVRPLTQHQPIKFPNSNRIFRRNLPAHLRQGNGCYAGGGRDMAHVVLARRHYSGNEDCLVPHLLQSFRKPNYVPGGTAHVETSDNAKNFHRSEQHAVKAVSLSFNFTLGSKRSVCDSDGLLHSVWLCLKSPSISSLKERELNNRRRAARCL